MSKRYRLYRAALGGLLVALLCGGESYAQSNSYPPAADSQSKQSEPAKAPAGENTSGASYREPRCEAPTSYEEANLCEQRRSAAAAEQQAIWGKEQAIWGREQAFWNKAQFYLGGVGLIAVIITLAFTAKATIAASKAAGAAEESVGAAGRAADAAEQAVAVATDTAKRQLRAYISVRDADLKPFEEGKIPEVLLRLVNAGQTPAQKFFINATFLAIPIPQSAPLQVPQRPPDSRSSIGPKVVADARVPLVDLAQQKPILYSQDIWNALTEGKLGLMLFGFAIYEDIFGQEQRTPFQFRSSRTVWGSFILIPDAQGNDAT